MTTSETIGTMLAYYAEPGIMTDPGEFAPRLAALPRDIPVLVQALQGLMLHIFWAERYGVHLDDARRSEVQIRRVPPKLARIFELDARPLDQARPPEQRLVGNCRDFSVTLAAFLQAQGVPARARCGFGTYFMPGHYEDHWMTEYWHSDEARWVQVDAQLDDLMKDVLRIPFDSLDMPRGQFVLAGEAWQMCRRGEANPDDFGIFEYKGWDFIKGNLMRDLLALNKVEVLPWDAWGLSFTEVAAFSPEQMAQMDRAAELTLAGDEAFSEVRSFYEAEPVLHIPEDWTK